MTNEANPGYTPSIHLPFDMDELHEVQMGMELLVGNYEECLKDPHILEDTDNREAFEEVLQRVQGIRDNVIEGQQKLSEKIRASRFVKDMLLEQQGMLLDDANGHADDNPTGCIKGCNVCDNLTHELEDIQLALIHHTNV